MPLVSGLASVIRASALLTVGIAASVGCAAPGATGSAAATAADSPAPPSAGSPAPGSAAASDGASPPAASASVAAPSAPGSGASSTGGASGDIVWLPEWAGADLPQAVAARRPLRFCGVERAPQPQPMEFIDQAVRLCFWEAARSGREAEFVSIQTTMEGAPFAQIYRLAADGTVEVLTDFTQDPLGSGGWQRMVCEELVEGEGESLLGVAGCGESTTIE